MHRLGRNPICFLDILRNRRDVLVRLIINVFFFIDTKRHALSFGRLVHYFDLNDKTHDILDRSLSDRMIIDRNIPDIRAKHRVILIFQKPVVNQVFIVSYALFADSDSDGISLEISIVYPRRFFYTYRLLFCIFRFFRTSDTCKHQAHGKTSAKNLLSKSIHFLPP